MPAGTILPWWGSLSAIPTGFLYCDGSNGTPDLRGRTLIGTGIWTDSYGSLTYSLGNAGGERMHRLTISEMPNHSHTVAAGGSTDNDSNYTLFPWLATIQDAYLGTKATSTAGGDQAHNNMMPYMTVHWIMKQ